MTPYEFISFYQGYLWRKQQQENTLASLVTVWIANYAGKVSKKNLTVKDIFADGRFNLHKKLTAEDRKIIEELYK